MVAAFIDFRKAYERVDRMKLWDCLGQYGIGGHFLMFLKELYEGSMSQVRISNRLDKEFAVTRGLRQGCALSPFFLSSVQVGNKMAAPEASVHPVRNHLCYHFFLYQTNESCSRIVSRRIMLFRSLNKSYLRVTAPNATEAERPFYERSRMFCTYILIQRLAS